MIGPVARAAAEPEVMDARRCPAPRSIARCLRRSREVNRVTLARIARPCAWLAARDRRLPRGAAVSHARCRLRRWRPAARASAAGRPARAWRVALEGIDLNPRSAVAAAAATPRGDGDHLPHRRRVRLRAASRCRTSSSARSSRIIWPTRRWCASCAGSTRHAGARLVHRRSAPPRARLLRLSAAGPRGGLAPHRAAGRRRSRSPAASAAPIGQALLAQAGIRRPMCAGACRSATASGA